MQIQCLIWWHYYIRQVFLLFLFGFFSILFQVTHFLHVVNEPLIQVWRVATIWKTWSIIIDQGMAYPNYLVMKKQGILHNSMFTTWGHPVAVVVEICTGGNLPQKLVCNNSKFFIPTWNLLSTVLYNLKQKIPWHGPFRSPFVPKVLIFCIEN